MAGEKLPDPKAELKAKRDKFIADKTEEVRIRMVEPWTAKLHDLILYRNMNAWGVRLNDIEREILKEAERLAKQ